MKVLKAIGKFFTFWNSISLKYDKLKNNEEKREKSVNLGVQSIVQTILFGALAFFAAWGFCICFKNFVSPEGVSSWWPVLSMIGFIVCGPVAVVSFIEGIIGGLLYMIYQFKLNKRAIRWVSLAVWILVFVAVIFGVIIVAR